MKNSTFCKSVLALAAIAVVFAFSSCGNNNAKRFKEAAMNLENTSFDLEWEYDYWPDGGIRNVGGHLASLISLNDLEKMLPCPLYVSGPHKDGKWDLYSEDFGHYNPEAIQYLADLAEDVVADKNFVTMSKPLVDKYLGRQMRCMMVLHDVMYDENLLDEEGRTFFFVEAMENYDYIDAVFYLLNNLYIDRVDEIYAYFNYEFYSFWARRYQDGTIDEFYDALSTVYKAYYPDYVFHLEDFYIEEYDEWEGDGEWLEGDEGWYLEGDYAPTVYNVELEDDEPIADDERIKEDKAIELIRTAVNNLDKTSLVLENEFDYWPECGIRVMGGHLFSLISLRTLNKILPCDLYVSGPHHYNHWELEDADDFGHYNPEAIQYLGKLAKKVVADKSFVDATRPLVDEYLKRQMLIMKGLYDGMNNPEICADKQAVLQDIMLRNGNIYLSWGDCPSCGLLGDLDLEDGSYVYSNTGEMFLYWWARRNVDGTMEQFHDILETVYNAYYGE